MKRTFALILAALLPLSLSLTAQAAPEPASPHDGIWKPIGAMASGAKLPPPVLKAITLKISGGNYEVTVEGEPHADKGTYTFDDTTTPKRLTIKGEEGPNKGKTILAIYEKKDADSMRVCYDMSGTDFPKEFAAPKGTQLFLAGYRRQKDGADAPADDASTSPARPGDRELTDAERARFTETGPALVKQFIATLRKPYTPETAGELRRFIDPVYLGTHKIPEDKFPIQTVVTGDIFDNQISADPRTLVITAATEGGAKEAFVFRTTSCQGRVYLQPLEAPDAATGLFKPWILRMKL